MSQESQKLDVEGLAKVFLREVEQDRREFVLVDEHGREHAVPVQMRPARERRAAA